jgi:hypothetical protein
MFRPGGAHRMPDAAIERHLRQRPDRWAGSSRRIRRASEPPTFAEADRGAKRGSSAHRPCGPPVLAYDRRHPRHSERPRLDPRGPTSDKGGPTGSLPTVGREWSTPEAPERLP